MRHAARGAGAQEADRLTRLAEALAAVEPLTAAQRSKLDIGEHGATTEQGTRVLAPPLASRRPRRFVSWASRSRSPPCGRRR